MKLARSRTTGEEPEKFENDWVAACDIAWCTVHESRPLQYASPVTV